MDKMKFEINDIVSFKYKGEQYIGIVMDCFTGSYSYSNDHYYDLLFVKEHLVIEKFREFELTLIGMLELDLTLFHLQDMYEGSMNEAISERNNLVSLQNRMDKLAFKIANIHHESQTDLSGEPYINHLITVANMVRQNTTDLRIAAVAYLHDILEDTKVTEGELLLFFPENVVTAVKAITKEKGEPYFDYLKRVKANKWATVVKIADLAHNSDISRIERELTSRDLKRIEKYKNAIEYLEEENLK